MRLTVSLLVLTALAGVASACPWWGRSCRPAPVVAYPYSPPPGSVIVYHYYPPPAPPEPPKTVEPPPAPATKELDPADLYEKAVRSCVFIITPLKGGFVEAAGALIDAEKRLVITTYQAVEESGQTFVQFPVRNKDGSLMTDKKKYIERIPAGLAIKGKVLHRDQTRDLALVQLDKLPPDTPALPLARNSVRPGSKVVWIGHAPAVNHTFSTAVGVVRAVGVQDFVVGGGDAVRRLKAKTLSITNPVPERSSGGPVLDLRGQVVGVAPDPGRGGRAVSLALDVTEVRAFLAEKKIRLKEPDDVTK